MLADKTNQNIICPSSYLMSDAIWVIFDLDNELAYSLKMN